MNDTDEREDTTASSPRDPHDDGARMEDPRAAHLAGQRAFKELTAPIRGSMVRSRLPPTWSSSSLGKCCWTRRARALPRTAVR